MPGTLAGASAAAKTVPSFFLYGEPRRRVSARFLHLELLEERCRPSNWTIRSHAHGELHHLFLIRTGGGEVDADGRTSTFQAPCLLRIPAGTVHGFRFQQDTVGQVLTVSAEYFRTTLSRAPEFAGLFTVSAIMPDIEQRDIGRTLARLARELSWSAPGHDSAVDACLIMILVEVIRQTNRMPEAPGAPLGRGAELVARYRESVELRYRSNIGVEQLAALLGVSAVTLRRACQAFAGCTPVQVLNERQILEAQRLLLYTSMTISEVASSLGFDDPAYFSRFFSKHAGRSPRQFRSNPNRVGQP